jgi:iron only hydrogenase large subunit-like protein
MPVIDQIATGASPHFIELMACPGGWIDGGGQPITRTNEQRARRTNAAYVEDRRKKLRKSLENREVQILYEDI